MYLKVYLFKNRRLWAGSSKNIVKCNMFLATIDTKGYYKRKIFIPKSFGGGGGWVGNRNFIFWWRRGDLDLWGEATAVKGRRARPQAESDSRAKRAGFTPSY